MGRSRGGLTTKIQALVDACGLPIVLKITEGQAHDGRSAQDMIGTVERGDVLLADRAYDSNTPRQRSQALLTILYCSTNRRCRRGAPMVNLAHSASFQSSENNAPSKLGIML